MRRTATLIIAVGFVFAFFSAEVAGIDLLIDAVGFLLVWNGVRALAAKEGGFGFASPCCLALVAICTAQLFFYTGTVGMVLAVCRALFEVTLFIMILRGFWRLFKKEERLGDGIFACVSFVGAMTATVLPMACLLWDSAPASWQTVVFWVVISCHALLLLALLHFSIVFGKN